jgi:hypothetical protein
VRSHLWMHQIEHLVKRLLVVIGMQVFAIIQ